MESTKNTNTKIAAPKTETKTAKTEEKKGTTAMKTEPKKTAAVIETAKTEPKTAPKTETRAAMIHRLYEESKTAASRNARREAAEAFEKEREAFNAASIENAASRCDFLRAAEALRPEAPKKAESRVSGFDYERRAEVVKYIMIDDNGEEKQRIMNLVTFARVAFMRRATKEQKTAFAAALAAVETFQKNNIENDSHEGLTAAAAALTALVKACGLDAFTAKTADNGEKYGFFIHKSFVHAAAARMKARRGVYVTEAAAVKEAAAAAVNASVKNHERAAARVKRAEEAAVKMIFSIITEAAAAAVVGNWKAVVMTAAEAEEAAKKAAAEAKEKEKAKKAAAAAKEREKAKKAKAAAAAKAKKEREAAKKTAAKAKKTAPKTAA